MIFMTIKQKKIYGYYRLKFFAFFIHLFMVFFWGIYEELISKIEIKTFQGDKYELSGKD
jgi:hypothetical protein